MQWMKQFFVLNIFKLIIKKYGLQIDNISYQYSFANNLHQNWNKIFNQYFKIIINNFVFNDRFCYKIEMETGTYITEISLNNDNQQQQQQKFTRFNLTQSKSHITLTEPIKKTRHANRLFNKNINNFLPDEYYTVKKVKPGLAFYRTILQVEERRKNQINLPYLNLQIPETLIMVENSLQLIYSQNGIVKVKTEANFNEFIKIVKPQTKVQIQPDNKSQNREETSKIYTAVLSGIGNGIYTVFSVSLSNELDSRILPRNQNQISMRFVQPYGEYPNTLRLYYVPKSIKGAKPNFAYKTINKKKLNEEILQRKYKQIHNFLVDYTKTDQIITTLVKGKALAQVQQMVQSMINYLEVAKKTKITEIVVDFIFGDDRIYYFHQIKNMKSVSLTAVWDIGTNDEMAEKYKQQTNQIMCKLCGFCFPRLEMTKMVTNKLISQLITHLKNRGQNIFCGSLTRGANLSASSNVCQLCYELIVAEHQLIDIQHEFYSLTNVKSDSVLRVKQTNSNNSKISFTNHENTDMTKWRLFFYIQKIKNAPLQNIQDQQNFTLNMKFNDFKQTFYRRYKRSDLYLQSRVNSGVSRSRKTQFKRINSSMTRHEKKSTMHTNYTNRSYDNFFKQNLIDFQKVKLVTFYTKENEISQILMNEQLRFQISYRNHTYKGDSSTLQNFSNKKQCQRHSCEVLLFDEKYQYCNLELNVGLICDGTFDTSLMALTKSENGSLYYSQDNYSCSPLPAEWIQIISEGLTLNYQTDSFQQTQIKIPTRPKSGYLFGEKSRVHKNWNVNISESKQQQQQQQYL